jgi:hypothetical protein
MEFMKNLTKVIYREDPQSESDTNSADSQKEQGSDSGSDSVSQGATFVDQVLIDKDPISETLLELYLNTLPTSQKKHGMKWIGERRRMCNQIEARSKKKRGTTVKTKL